MKHITCYLDFVSPYAWLALEQMPKALQGLSYHVDYRPVLLGALLQGNANPGPAGIPAKRLWTYRHVSWLGHALTGDFGSSFVTRQPVLGELLNRLAVTFQLTLLAAVIAAVMGVATGLAAARLRGVTDWLVRLWNGLMLAVPNYVVATLIVLLFGLYFPEITVLGYTPFLESPLANLGSLLLPALALALAVSVTVAENTRAAVLEVANQDFVMVARAKGLKPGTILRDYLMRNALTPVVTAAGLKIAALLGGSILVETIFAIPGMGQYLFDSINSRDYPVIQAIVLVAAGIVVLVNTVIDIAYARIDARVQM